MKKRTILNNKTARNNETVPNKRRFPNNETVPKKGIALALCAAMILGGTIQPTHTLAAEGNGEAAAIPGSCEVTAMGGSHKMMVASGLASAKVLTDAKKAGGSKAANGTAAADSISETAASKEETVYILAGADGSVREIISSDWLKNPSGADTITDRSELVNIENVKGEELYTLSSDNAQVWDAQGGDIYYRGNTEKELPVSFSVSYTLDGTKISPEELAGKSGRVTIRFDYVNEQYEYTQVGDSREKIYVPFAMMTGMLLDDEVFRNVEVTNGKLIDDGGRTAVVGIAFPGLSENLDIDREKLDIPDYLEITADVSDFELGMTVTVATNEIFSVLDTDEEKDVTGELSEALEQLTDAMEQLEDGSDRLYDGLCTLLQKSDELIQGVDRLASGAGELRSGAASLEDGAAKLQDGAARLQTGLNTLTSNNAQLNGGARQVFETLLSTAQSQLTAAGLSVPAMTVDNYADVLNAAIASLDGNAVYQQALAVVTEKVEANRPAFESAVTAAVEEQVRASVTAVVEEAVTEQVRAAVHDQAAESVIPAVTGAAGSSMTKAEYEEAVSQGNVPPELQEQVENAIAGQMESEAVRSQIAALVEQQMQAGEGKAQVEANVAVTLQSDDIKNKIADNVNLEIQKMIAKEMEENPEVQETLNAASAGAKAIIDLKASLDSYNVFYKGLQSYTAGVAEAANGAGELTAGTGELRNGSQRLYSGTSELYDGIQTMKNSTPALTDGIRQLRDGAQQLRDGLVEFDREGIQKLVEAVDGDLEGLTDRVRAMTDLAKEYQSFSGIGDDMEGKVKFVYRTGSIEP